MEELNITLGEPNSGAEEYYNLTYMECKNVDSKQRMEWWLQALREKGVKDWSKDANFS